jgi:aspartokinase-like uncharacterized kinase
MKCEPSITPIVVKVGGSLYDLPDLRGRLQCWLESLSATQIILVPGGGPFADAIRVLDQRFCLGEEHSHWLALSALTVAARFLAALLPATAVIQQIEDAPVLWARRLIPIVDPYTLSKVDDHHPEALPHSWNVTSDSIAARVAVLVNAPRLVLLKSRNPSPDPDWARGDSRDLVDPWFANTIGPGFVVQAVNLREWRP